VVYGVSVEGENVWVATAAGGCRLDLRTGQWSLYNERNTPMVEIWVYGVSATPTKVYYAVWGSGLLEYDQKTKVWDKYDDPDGENEMVLFKDQGLIHEIVTSVSYVDNILWAATYFGDSRYDGRYWHNFLVKDSGLPSNFTNFIKGVDAKRAWFCTDKGLGVITDFESNTWVTYQMDPKTHHGKATVYRDRDVLEEVESETGIPHNFIIAADMDGKDVWIGTSKGLAWGQGAGYYPGLRERTPATRFLHTGVDNVSARYRQPAAAQPCAIACLDCAADLPRLQQYAAEFPVGVRIDRFVVFCLTAPRK